MLAFYDDVCHLGLERSLDLLKDQFYWPHMNQDMETHIKQCDRCLRYIGRPTTDRITSIIAIHPMELYTWIS